FRISSRIPLARRTPMMRTAAISLLASLFAVLGTSCKRAQAPTAAPPNAPTPAATPPPPKPPEEPAVDVIPEARRMNSAEFAAPSPATPPPAVGAPSVPRRKLPSAAIKGEQGGFRVTLPSGAPVRTPAVYAGVVFTSGGFHSREFYAFDARSGALRWALDLDD